MSYNAYKHLTHLSLDWHLKKKMGNAIRSFDRGVISADSIMNYLVLMLGSTILEVIVTVVLVSTYYKSI